MTYFPGLLYFTAGAALYLTPAHTGSPPYFIAVALGGLIAGTLLNVLGLETGKRLVNLAAVARSLAIVFLAAFGILAIVHHTVATPVTAASLLPHFDLKELVFLSFIALAFSGPEALPFMAEEVRDPERSIPRGLAIAAPVVVGIYIIGTLGVFALLPSARTDSLYGVMQAFLVAAQSGGGRVFLIFLVALVLVSCLGSLTAWLGANARLPFVAGIDNYLPSSFGYLHPKYRSPVTSLCVQFGVAAVLVVLGQSGTSVKGAYDILVSCTVLATMLPFLLMFLSAVKIGWGNPGIVIAACVGFCTALAALVLSAFPNPDDPAPLFAVLKIVGLNVLMLLAGTAFYFGRSRQLARRALARQASSA